MTQELPLDGVIRARLKGLRLARGWSLDALAARCHLSPSTLSRIETGHRRISIDQLAPIARALGTSLDQLVEPVDGDNVVIRPRRDLGHGATTWILTRDDEPHGLAVGKMRITASKPTHELRVHPGHEWFTVLSGTAQAAPGGPGHPGRVRAGRAVLHDVTARHHRRRRPGRDHRHLRPRRPPRPPGRHRPHRSLLRGPRRFLSRSSPVCIIEGFADILAPRGEQTA